MISAGTGILLLKEKKGGGGTVLATKKSSDVTRQYHWDSHFEDLSVSIYPQRLSRKAIHVRVRLCYLPPHLTVAEISQFYQSLYDILLQTDVGEELICVGDFNTPSVAWTKDRTSLIMPPSSAA